MPKNAIIPDREAAPETAKEKFERERLSRRQALKRLGMMSAMATFALFSVHDLARMVGKAMEQRAGDDKVVEAVAQELQQAGVVLAAPNRPPFPGPMNPCVSQGDNLPVAQRGPCCTPDAVGYYCSGYPDYKDCDDCVKHVYGPNGYCTGYNNPAGTQGGQASSTYCPKAAPPG